MSKKNKEYKEKAKQNLINHIDINCKCGAVGSKHFCPYDEDVNARLTSCKCCVHCTKQCADDI